MRILLGYSYYEHPFCIRTWTEGWLARLRAAGVEVEGFPLTLKPPGPNLLWKELDARWRRGDRELLEMYERLARRLEEESSPSPPGTAVSATHVRFHPSRSEMTSGRVAA